MTHDMKWLVGGLALLALLAYIEAQRTAQAQAAVVQTASGYIGSVN